MFIPKSKNSGSSSNDNFDTVNLFTDLKPVGVADRIYHVKSSGKFYIYDVQDSVYLEKLPSVTDVTNATAINTLQTAQISNLETIQNAHASSLTGLGTRVTNNENNIVTLNTFKGNQETLNTNHTAQLGGLQADVTNFNLEISGLGTLVTNNENSIINLGNRVTTNENNIVTLNTFKSNQETLNTNHAAQLSGLQADVTNFNLEITNLDNYVSLNATSINATNGRVTTLESAAVTTGTTIVNLGNRVTTNENNIITLNTFKGDQETININNTSAFTSLGARTFNLESVDSAFRIGNLEVTDGVHLNRIEALEAKTIIGASNMTITGSGSNTIIDTKQNIKVTDTPTFANVISGAPTLDTHLTNKLYCDRFFTLANLNPQNQVIRWQPYLRFSSGASTAITGHAANFWCIRDTCFCNFRVSISNIVVPAGTNNGIEFVTLKLPLKVAVTAVDDGISPASSNVTTSAFSCQCFAVGGVSGTSGFPIMGLSLATVHMIPKWGDHTMLMYKGFNVGTGFFDYVVGNDLAGKNLFLQGSMTYKCKYPYEYVV